MMENSNTRRRPAWLERSRPWDGCSGRGRPTCVATECMYGLDQTLKPRADTCAFVDQGSVTASPPPSEAPAPAWDLTPSWDVILQLRAALAARDAALQKELLEYQHISGELAASKAALLACQQERDEFRSYLKSAQRAWHAELNRAAEATEALTAIHQRLQALVERWRTHADELRAAPVSITSQAAIGWLSQCADELAAVLRALGEEGER